MAKSPHEKFDTLTTAQRMRLIQDVFVAMEYDEAGNPGAEWSSDTLQAIAEKFNAFGVVFTDPNDNPSRV